MKENIATKVKYRAAGYMGMAAAEAQLLPAAPTAGGAPTPSASGVLGAPGGELAPLSACVHGKMSGAVVDSHCHQQFWQRCLRHSTQASTCMLAPRPQVAHLRRRLAIHALVADLAAAERGGAQAAHRSR